MFISGANAPKNTISCRALPRSNQYMGYSYMSLLSRKIYAFPLLFQPNLSSAGVLWRAAASEARRRFGSFLRSMELGMTQAKAASRFACGRTPSHCDFSAPNWSFSIRYSSVRLRRKSPFPETAADDMNPSPSWFSANFLNSRSAATTVVFPSWLKK